MGVTRRQLHTERCEANDIERVLRKGEIVGLKVVNVGEVIQAVISVKVL
jgi:hypothetical protein